MIEIQVPGDGPYNAKIMIVGEAPAKHELESKKNFFGPSGDILFNILHDYGLNRSNIYITNVFKVRLPGDNIKRIHEIMNEETIEKYINFLQDEIDAIKPNVIIALGNTALAAITGKSKIGGTGILKYRGSILQSLQGGYKVVSSIHPAALLERQENKELFTWKQIVFLRFDINRAVEESKFPEINIPKRNIIICKKSHDLYSFLKKNDGRDKAANDIETFKSIPICTALCFDPNEAISIPLVNLSGPGNSSIKIERHERVEIFKLLADFFISKVKKVGQNYNFDQTIQERFGWKINNFHSDIMLKMSVLYPELPKKLAVSTSLFTKEPYYKDEGKEYNPKKDIPERLLRYNGMDACLTQEIDDFLETEFDRVRR